MITISFGLAMAINERGNNGKYTGFHWRKEFKKFLETINGKKWLVTVDKENKKYIRQMMKEIK